MQEALIVEPPGKPLDVRVAFLPKIVKKTLVLDLLDVPDNGGQQTQSTSTVNLLIFSVTELNMHLPTRMNLDLRQQNTLLDGELVGDQVPYFDPELKRTLKRPVVRFLIYDAISIEDDGVGANNLIERLNRVKSDIIAPRLKWYVTGHKPVVQVAHESRLQICLSAFRREKENPEMFEAEKIENRYVEMYLKDFYEVWDVPAIVALGPRLFHLSDGIIFTPVNGAYVPGTCQSLLKWKPPHLNTVSFVPYGVLPKSWPLIYPASSQCVDFGAELIPESMSTLVLEDPDKRTSRKVLGIRLSVANRGARTYEGHWLALQGEHLMEIVRKFENGADEYRTGIWECNYDLNAVTKKPAEKAGFEEMFDFDDITETKGGWCFERIRTDKELPNDTRTVTKVMESIEDNVQLTDLTALFGAYYESGKETISENCDMPTFYEEHGSEAYLRKKPNIEDTQGIVPEFSD